MKPVTRIIAAAIAATSAIAGTAHAQTYRTDTAPSHEYRNLAALGVVESIETIEGTQRGNKVAGTILGGILGGVLGHQIGSGRGNDVATVAGALGGAAVGHEIGENKGSRDSYRVSVVMDNGDVRFVQQDSAGGLRSGDRVRVDGDRVTLSAGSERDDGRRYAPSDAYVAPEAGQELYRADDRIEYRPDYRPDYRPGYRPGARPDDSGYRYRNDPVDDSGYRYRDNDPVDERAYR